MYDTVSSVYIVLFDTDSNKETFEVLKKREKKVWGGGLKDWRCGAVRGVVGSVSDHESLGPGWGLGQGSRLTATPAQLSLHSEVGPELGTWQLHQCLCILDIMQNDAMRLAPGLWYDHKNGRPGNWSVSLASLVRPGPLLLVLSRVNRVASSYSLPSLSHSGI